MNDKLEWCFEHWWYFQPVTVVSIVVAGYLWWVKQRRDMIADLKADYLVSRKLLTDLKGVSAVWERDEGAIIESGGVYVKAPPKAFLQDFLYSTEDKLRERLSSMEIHLLVNKGRFDQKDVRAGLELVETMNKMVPSYTKRRFVVGGNNGCGVVDILEASELESLWRTLDVIADSSEFYK